MRLRLKNESGIFLSPNRIWTMILWNWKPVCYQWATLTPHQSRCLAFSLSVSYKKNIRTNSKRKHIKVLNQYMKYSFLDTNNVVKIEIVAISINGKESMYLPNWCLIHWKYIVKTYNGQFFWNLWKLLKWQYL